MRPETQPGDGREAPLATAASPAGTPAPDHRLAAEKRIAYLEGRVASLESALQRRAAEVCLIQRHICRRDLIIVSRLLAGLPLLPLGAYEPAFWQETTVLTGAEVDATLEDLWISVFPPRLTPEGDEGDRER